MIAGYLAQDPELVQDIRSQPLPSPSGFEQDTAGRELDLRYFRDIDRREVDFVVTERGRPIKFVQCKWSDADVDGGLRCLRAKFPSVEAWQVFAAGRKDYQTPDGIRVSPAIELLKNLL